MSMKLIAKMNILEMENEQRKKLNQEKLDFLDKNFFIRGHKRAVRIWVNPNSNEDKEQLKTDLILGGLAQAIRTKFNSNTIREDLALSEKWIKSKIK